MTTIKQIVTPNGDIFVWTPSGATKTRGTVIYLHGDDRDAAGALRDHGLIGKFDRSDIDATFIVPEAPKSAEDTVRFPNLDVLLTRVNAVEKLGTGPVIVLAHSAGYRTAYEWLKSPRLSQLALLDALYRHEGEFQYFAKTHRMTVFGRATDAQGRRLVGAVGGLALPSIPDRWTDEQQSARVVYAKSQFLHDDIPIRELPIVAALRRSSLHTRDAAWMPAVVTGAVVAVVAGIVGIAAWRANK